MVFRVFSNSFRLLRWYLALLLVSLPVHAAEIQIFIAGDSTAATYSAPDQQGWGALLGDYIDPQKATVHNLARGGRSSRTFISEGSWQSLIDQVKPGDIVIIQFGHNDASKINDDSRARGTLPGIGDESVTIDNLLTRQTETVYTFGHYLRKMANDVLAKKATPVLMSLTQSNNWQNGSLLRNGSYGRWAYELALELNVPFVDLNNLVADRLEALGAEKVAAFYPKDNTHFNPDGARIHTETALSAFKGLRPDMFTGLLNEKGQALKKDDLSWLRLPIPANANLRSVFLIGDSTVRNGAGDGANGEWGWGDFLLPHLDAKKVNVVNRAVGGLSSRTFYTGDYWKRALNMMRSGDVLVMQFGHNDAAPINDDSRARGTLKGTANNEEQIDNLLTGKPETVYSYGGYLRRFIGEAKARGITVVVCSSIPRNVWKNKQIVRAENSYPQWAKEVALQSGSAFIDLHHLIAHEYDQLGAKKVEALFADERTHTSKAGAELNAAIVAKSLKPLLGL
ncbi:rhamnogalacturonan acetylesterase [Cellvibrio polysaccharolyticus]|uniref:GDSL family lipase n=1 Tax=Cellvibrio polysaccharolyticus TaxID=2082724 RepID=A0A928YTI2_9GAMM|nr:rhamnogalacturonan acetylesterase [Cellvibrio polysaccharolyticus]MBE8717044.1 GDSL family lipase [Cellvibrio polysaccharolyticus]